MSFNKNNIFGVKGAIGEVLVANYLKYSRKIETTLATDQQQKKGIDLVYKAPFSHNADVKLSDCEKGFFSITYRNSKGLRHPFRNDTESHEIIICDYDWDLYAQTHTKQIKKTEKQLEKALAKYVPPEELESLITAVRSSKGDTVEALKELYVAHRTNARLMEEFEGKGKYEDTKNLIENYTRSIFSVHISHLINAASDFDKMQYGEKKVIKGKDVIEKQYRKDRFGNVITVAKINQQSFDLDCYYSNPKYKKPDPEFRTTIITFGKNRGKELRQVEDSYVRWLHEQAANKGGLDQMISQEYDFRFNS